MLISAVVNIVVSKMLFKVGKEADSAARQVDAWHLRTDVYTATGVMIGFALIWMGHQVFPGLDVDWLDPVAAIGVGLVPIRAVYQLTVQSARDLIDASLPQEEEAWIRQLIREHRSAIHGFDQFRALKAGHHLRFFGEGAQGFPHSFLMRCFSTVPQEKLKGGLTYVRRSN